MADNLKRIEELLKALSNAHGVSGHEESVRDILWQELKPPCTDERTIDKLGNLIATKNGGKKPSVMLCAHMDEVGLSTSHITEDGFLHFIDIGDWCEQTQTLLNQRVKVHVDGDDLLGVIGSKPAHLLEEEEKEKPIKIKDMFIDIGARNGDDARDLGVKIGTPITIDREFKPLKNNLVTGKALDDRAGCTVMIEAMRRTTTEATVYAVGSVQEEFRPLGAQTAAFGLKPNVAIAVETEYADDYPEKNGTNLKLGKGPSVTVVDGGLITPVKVLQWIEETAEKCHIDCQRYVGKNGTTDAADINRTRKGIPSGVVSVVTRYIHTPIEVLDLDDLNNAAELIAGMLKTVGKYF